MMCGADLLPPPTIVKGGCVIKCGNPVKFNRIEPSKVRAVMKALYSRISLVGLLLCGSGALLYFGATRITQNPKAQTALKVVGIAMMVMGVAVIAAKVFGVPLP